jgi:hypothetical protein
MVNLSNTESATLKKRTKTDEAYKKTSQTLNEPKVLKKSMSNILKGNFLFQNSYPVRFLKICTVRVRVTIMSGL